MKTTVSSLLETALNLLWLGVHELGICWSKSRSVACSHADYFWCRKICVTEIWCWQLLVQASSLSSDLDSFGKLFVGLKGSCYLTQILIWSCGFCIIAVSSLKVWHCPWDTVIVSYYKAFPTEDMRECLYPGRVWACRIQVWGKKPAGVFKWILLSRVPCVRPQQELQKGSDTMLVSNLTPQHECRICIQALVPLVVTVGVDYIVQHSQNPVKIKRNERTWLKENDWVSQDFPFVIKLWRRAALYDHTRTVWWCVRSGHKSN